MCHDNPKEYLPPWWVYVLLSIICLTVSAGASVRIACAEVFKVDLPSGTASCNGDWIIKGGQVKEIYTQDGNKMVEVNQNKFIVYDISPNEIFGRLFFDVDVTSKSFEFDVNLTCASSDALPIKSPGYYEKRWTYLGVKKTLIER